MTFRSLLLSGSGWARTRWGSCVLGFGFALVFAFGPAAFGAEEEVKASYEPRFPWDTPLQGLATLGVALAEDRDVDQYPFSARGDKLELNPGFAVTLGTGGQLQRWLRLELETGLIANELHRIGNDQAEGYMANFPLLLNTVLMYDSPKSRWVPYIGAGLGANVSALDIDSAIGFEGNFWDITYAAQAVAGLRYKVSRKLSLGIGYKYLHTGSLEFEDDDSPATRMRFGGGGMHTLSLVFMIRR